jgi:hypothetical protein
MHALSKHLWNTALCESLYPSFQILEVGFRNALHTEIAATTGDPQWLTNPPGFLYPDETQSISAAKDALRSRRLDPTEPRLVAEMSFGFWTSLLDVR